MTEANIKLENSWKKRLSPEFAKPYMQNLKAFLQAEKAQNKVLYPRGGDIFAALNHTPFDKVKVVILGQDPYHGPGQAHGLCFSVGAGIPPPPSLKNIYKELQADLGLTPPLQGSLTAWANQGVLLLNSVLTVEQNKPGSHQGRGWEEFTDKIIALLNQEGEHLVFMLWGSYAKKKGVMIDRSCHLVLEAAHPSPLSAYNGFRGCKHFSKANAYLLAHQKDPIDWSLSS